MPPEDNLDQEQREREMLTTCALRIDGYRYAEDHGREVQHYAERLRKVGIEHLTNDELLMAFFAYQRGLCKWGGEMTPQNHGDWRQFCELFLRAVHCDLPKAYID